MVMVGVEGWCVRQAHLTFAMARHAVVDLSQVFSIRLPRSDGTVRLTDQGFVELAEQLERAGMRFSGDEARARLAVLRAMYEPYVIALSRHLVLPLPEWTRSSDHPDNWQAAPWKAARHPSSPPPEHF